ncbi:hypothetical protein [Methanosarcina sp. DH1]|uniref:hypothetical protein n=1 Tax=Methanosarcina sp. DH1 TaxID=2605695 RepID=UPI001E3D1672|nr:hypothetical protein [Methanosarcina sp. DH1]
MNLSPNPIGVITTLFKKGLTENHEPIFGFDELIPKPYRRDQPAQRLRVNGCRSTVAGQRLLKKPSGCSFWLFIT